MQSPEPRGGGIILRDYWRIWDADAQADNDVKFGAYPSFDYIVASFDGAFGTKLENDWSAFTVWGPGLRPTRFNARVNCLARRA